MADTTNHSWSKPTVGGSEGTWGSDLNTIFDAQDEAVPHILDSGTFTASGGSTPAADVTQTGVTSDQTAQFDVIVSVDSDPAFNADYAFNYDVSRAWDDSDSEWDITITVNWDTDPGSSNDVTMKYSVQDRQVS